jgi:hypothetical protein
MVSQNNLRQINGIQCVFFKHTAPIEGRSLRKNNENLFVNMDTNLCLLQRESVST